MFGAMTEILLFQEYSFDNDGIIFRGFINPTRGNYFSSVDNVTWVGVGCHYWILLPALSVERTRFRKQRVMGRDCSVLAEVCAPQSASREEMTGLISRFTSCMQVC